jgi:hypothetical protein
MKRFALILLVPMVLVASCILIRGRISSYVHPQIAGSVVDIKTGQPIENATVAFVRSDFGGGTTLTDANGEYRLPAVVEKTWITFPGDPYYRSFVVASADGYVSVEHETGHGTGEVWGGGPPPRRVVRFLLNRDEVGRSVEQ